MWIMRRDDTIYPSRVCVCVSSTRRVVVVAENICVNARGDDDDADVCLIVAVRDANRV